MPDTPADAHEAEVDLWTDEEDPLGALAGSLSCEPFADDLDKELYG